MSGEEGSGGAPSRDLHREGGSSMLDMLRGLPILAGLDPESLTALGRSLTRLRRRDREPLFSEGDPCTGLYLVERGSIRVFRVLEDGREYTIDLLGPGEPTPLVAFLDGGPAPASAEASEDTDLLFLPRPAFVEVIRRRPEVLERVIAILSKRLRDAHRWETELALHTVHGRIASTLLRLEAEHRAGLRTLSHEELAHLVGAARETVTRALHDMAKQGALVVGREGIEIKDTERLKTWLESS